MRASVLYFLRLHCNFLYSLPNHRKVARRFHHWADHYLTTTVQLPCEMSEKPVVTTNNGLFVGLGAPVQNQQNSRFNVGLYRPVVVLRPGRPEVRILPVALKKRIAMYFCNALFVLMLFGFSIISVTYHLRHRCTALLPVFYFSADLWWFS